MTDEIGHFVYRTFSDISHEKLIVDILSRIVMNVKGEFFLNMLKDVSAID